MLLGTLGGSLLENLLAGKGVKVKIPERGAIRAGEGAMQQVSDEVQLEMVRSFNASLFFE